MKTAEWLIACEPDAWHLARAADDGAEPRAVRRGGEDEAERLAAAAAEMGYDGRAVCLSLPSEMVFSAEIDTAGLPRRQRHRAMLYRLEEHLPLDAEDLTAGFIPAGAGRALGVAVRTRPVADLIETLTRAGLEVGSVRPTALLALWSAFRADGREPTARFAVVAGKGSADVFRLSEAGPAAWCSVGVGPEQLRRAVRAELLARPEDRPTAWLVVGALPVEAAAALEAELGQPPDSTGDAPPLEMAAQAARSALSEGQAGWVELRRGQLSGGSPWARFHAALKAAAVLAVLLPAVLLAGLLWRSHRYEAVATGHGRMQQQIFAELYPNQQVPLEVRSRLASEHKRLAGISGSGTRLPARPCALAALRRVVAHLPGDVRLRIERIDVRPDVVHVHGQARGHGDAERICQKLRQAGFEVGSPSTELLVGGGVSFTVVLTRPRPDGPAMARGGGS
jgi:hypothetical protein